MSDALYVHGIIISQATGEAQEIRSPSASVVGIVGTAPASRELTVNLPAAFLGKKAALDAIYPQGATAAKGTLYEAAIGVQEQGLARMVLVKSSSDSQADILKAIEALPLAKSVTGYKPKILIAPGFGSEVTQDAVNPSPSPTPAPNPNPEPENNRNRPRGT
jgi:phage tail sheath protein FI